MNKHVRMGGLRRRHAAPTAALATLLAVTLALAGSGCGKRGGCKTDHDCKGSRVCNAGACVDPTPAQWAPPQGAVPGQPVVTTPPAAIPPPLTPPQAPVAPRAPRSHARPGNGSVLVSDPPCGCKKDGVIYDRNGAVYGCEGGGNWCASSGPLPGGCPPCR